MDNDTISNQENYEDLNDGEPNYLGNKREADTELNKVDSGNICNKEEEEFIKMKLANKGDSKLKEEAESLCRNLFLKKDEKDFRELNPENEENDKIKNPIPNPPNQIADLKNYNVANCMNKEKENVVKIGDFVILEKDGPDNESDIEEEDHNKDNSFRNQVGTNSFSYNVNGNSFNPLKRNEIQKINTIIQNVEFYKANLNKNVQRKCVCCDRSDLFPSEMLKFKTIEDFLIYFKFLYDKRVSVLKTDEENFEKNREVLNEFFTTLQKIQKFNLKSVRYLCKTCLVTKLNQAEGLNFIFRAMEIHLILENFTNTNVTNQTMNISANYSTSNLLNASSKPPIENNSLNPHINSASNKKKNLFETKFKLEDNTPIDHQLIENLKMGLTSNTHSGNLINPCKLGNFGTNLNDNKNTMNMNFNHSQILNKIANAKEEESGNLQSNFDNMIGSLGCNNNGNSGNINSSNSNFNINMSNPHGMNRGIDVFNLLNMNRVNTQNLGNPMSNPQMILQKIAEVQSNINNMNPIGMPSFNPNIQSNPSNNLSLNLNNFGPNNLTNITNFSNNFSQVVDAINSFNSKNINHNSNIVNSVSQLAGVLSNYVNEEGENNVPSNGVKIPELNLDKEGEGDVKNENSREKDHCVNEDEKKEDVNVTNIIMNFDKAPILSYMMNVLEDLKKQIVAIQYYSLLQKLFISYIFKNLEVLMEQISNNQINGSNPSMHEFNQNTAFMNFFQKMGGGQNQPKNIENLFNMIPQNMNLNTVMNMPNVPDFFKKTDDGKLNPLMNTMNNNNQMDQFKNLNNSCSSTNGGLNSMNMLNFLNNTNKNQSSPVGNLNISGINNPNQNQNFNPNFNQHLPNNHSTMPNISSNTLLDHLLKNKGNHQGGNMGNMNNMQNISQLNNLMKQPNTPHPFVSNMPNMPINNMIGMHGPSVGNFTNQLPGMGNIPGIANLSSMNSLGGINNPLLLPHLQQGNNLPPFSMNQPGNNQAFSMHQMLLSGLPNNLQNNMGNLKNINNMNISPINHPTNELNNSLNNLNSQSNSKMNMHMSQNANLPMNLLNMLSHYQQNSEGNNQGHITDSNQNNPIQGNEIENNLFKFINNQNNQNHPVFNQKSQDDVGVFNNLNSSNNNMNIHNQEQLLQYLMMNQSQMVNSELLKHEKYSEELHPKPNNE